MTDTATPPAGTPPAGTPPAGNWFDGMGADDIAYINNRGLHKLDQRTAFLQTVQAHKQAEGMIGAPAEKLLHLPKDASDAEGWQRFDDRLGVPKDGKYDFSGVKFTSGDALDEEFTGVIAAALKSAHIPASAASDIIKPLVAYMEKAEASDVAERANVLDVNRMELKADWGQRFTPNMLMVQNMTKTLGLAPEFVNNIEKEVGYTKTMQTLLDLAHKLGEDQFITTPGSGGGPNVPISKEQAKATLDAKMNDQDWAKKLMNGDAAAVKEFDMLTRMTRG